MLLILGLAFALQVASQPVQVGADEILAQLSELRLDKNRIHRVRDITIRRDVVSLSFERGLMAFLEPVEGRVTGAVFVGSGDVLVLPPDDTERRQLNRFTGSPILNRRFEAAILRFTDDTYDEVLAELEDRAFEDVRADELEALLPWERNLGELSFLQNFRIMGDIVSQAERPFFFATLNEPGSGWLDVAFDERTSEEVLISTIPMGTPSGMADIWASFNRRSEARNPEASARSDEPPVDVLSYDLDTTIDRDAWLELSARVRLRPNLGGDRLLEFKLTPTLRISDVRLGGASVPFFQHPVESSAALGVPISRLDSVAVALPYATVAGEELDLQFEYEGPALEQRGERVFFTSERVRWYPQTGLSDPATFQLTFHHPADDTLAATGALAGEAQTGEIRHSRWTSGGEYFMAGFTYGDFTVMVDDSGAVPVHVYVRNDMDPVLGELGLDTAGGGETASDAPPRTQAAPGGSSPGVGGQARFSPRELGANILNGVREPLAFLSDRLGGFPFPRLTLTHIATEFSQGWPSLLHVPTLPFLDPAQRDRLGLGPADDGIPGEFERTRQLAHQWFGNRVGPKSYRDQWLIEGLAGYSAILYLESRYPGTGSASDALADLGRRLLTPTAGGVVGTHDDNGPIWLGHRLARAAVPDGYSETIDTKSTWVFHMLRHLLSEPAGPQPTPLGPDAPFLEMLRAFLDEYDGRSATMWDFKTVAERYLTPRADVSGEGNLDWFFDQWVLRTGIPRIEIDYQVLAEGDGFIVSGQVAASGVSDFTMPVPIYSRTAGGDVYLGDVLVEDSESDVFFFVDARPDQILIDPHGTILKR